MCHLRSTIRALSLIGLIALISACATRPEVRVVDIPQGSAASKSIAAWFAGDTRRALDIAQPSQTPEARFFTAEIMRFNGDIEKAFDLYAAFVIDFPNHAFARYAAARVHTLRSSVVDFSGRAPIIFDRVDWSRLAPLTRIYLAMAQQSAEYQRWVASDSVEPFDTASVGLPGRYNVTPNLSPWRLLDLKTEFAPESTSTLDPRYLSPALADDVEQNYVDTVPYHLTGISSSFRPGQGDGIYYFESFVEVSGDEARDYWLYGSFASAVRVYLNGEQVMHRDEKTYDGGKYLRKITLEPGVHRLLVKQAYQQGYRDWFDLMFVPDGARQLTQAGLKFSSACLESREVPGCIDPPDALAGMKLTSEQRAMIDEEPVYLPEEKIKTASDTSLYLAMVSAHFSADVPAFDRAWAELSERRDSFGAGHALNAQHVQTLWEVPSRLRDTAYVQSLRAAVDRDPESLYNLTALGSQLSDRAREREVRTILESARDKALDGSTLRYARPLANWAQFLASQGWSELAEKEWARLVELAPFHCTAATRLQALEHNRALYRHPREITPEWKSCPNLEEAWTNARTDAVDARLALLEKRAARYPLSATPHLRYAEMLVQMGREAQARQHIDDAIARMPDAMTLWNWKIDRALASEGPDAALDLLEQARAAKKNEAWMIWKAAAITGELPLQGLMPDGLEAARSAVSSSKVERLSNDDAYYVVDFAARLYAPDTSSVTLTHTLVRVMSKAAIDRYGETSIPGDARLVLARTVKQDGSTRVPETQAGKSTLSMPGLAEGDFVEIAYLQFKESSTPSSHLDGVRFFFQMPQISTLHSEYVILGQTAEFILANDPPEVEEIEHAGLTGVRFLARDNPRPREEPRSVSFHEFLPWIQMYRQGLTIGDFEASRRSQYERIVDSLKVGSRLKEIVKPWIEAKPHKAGSEAHVRQIFYRVAEHIPTPTATDFSTDVTHAALSRDGSSHLLLKAAYEMAGIPADVFVVRTQFADPVERPLNEFRNYGFPTLRVTVPETGETRWATPDGPDAMFNALGPAVWGAKGVCVTCEERTPTRLPADGLRSNTESVEIDAKVDLQGTLQASMTLTYDGAAAMAMRQALRSRKDDTNRTKLMAFLAEGRVAGSTLKGFEIDAEEQPDAPLVLTLDVVRPNFARASGDVLQIETRLFEEPLARIYAQLSNRTTPLLVESARDRVSSITLELPRAPNLRSSSGTATLDSPWGRVVRTTQLEGTTLTIDNQITMPVQRVYPTEYEEFRKWAISVEQSASLFLTF